MANKEPAADPSKEVVIKKTDMEYQPSYADGTVGDVAEAVAIDPVIERKLKCKADFIIIPVLGMTYLFNSLDRSNVSNAQTAGLSTDLGLKGNHFSLVLTYYFIPFCLFGPPSGMLAKQFSAKFAIPVMMGGFGVASIATAFATNFGQLVACRIIVGIFESGFLTACVYYLSIWYTRKEIGTRIGIFYASLVASSAFGGLISYGVFQMKNTHRHQWFYLFIIEGTMTVVFGLVTLAVIPRNIRSAWFLTDAEKDVAEARIVLDSAESLSNKFSWKDALMELKTPHPYVRTIIAITYSTLLTSNSTFLAIIVARLGFSTVKTNLYTVAPSLVAALFLTLVSYSSDRFRERGLHMAVALIISIVGYTLLIKIDLDRVGVTYFAIFLTTVGAYPMSPINNAWIVSNIPNLNARAFTSALLISIANTAGLISSNIMIASEAPRYITSCRVNLGAAVLCLVTSAVYSMWMRWENRRRDRLQGRARGSAMVPTGGIHDTTDMRFRFSP